MSRRRQTRNGFWKTIGLEWVVIVAFINMLIHFVCFLKKVCYISVITAKINSPKSMEPNTYHQIQQSTEIEMDVLQVGSEPVGIRCPYCQEDVMTKATYRNSSTTHLAAVILAILFWWLCCCIIPYFVKRWKNVDHFCSNCGRFIGVYTRKTII